MPVFFRFSTSNAICPSLSTLEFLKQDFKVSTGKIKKSYGAHFFNWILVNWKVKINNKHWILGTNNYSKYVKSYINQFGFPIRIFCRKPIENFFSSSKDICEKLKKISQMVRISKVFRIWSSNWLQAKIYNCI